MHIKNCNCNEHTHCGCKKPELCGCKTKVDLLCSFYSGTELQPLNIESGTDGNTVIKKINDYLKDLPEVNDEPTFIDNVGGKIEVYKGQNPGTLVHEFKTIQGSEGVIVEDAIGTGNCDNGEYINVKIDKKWIKDYIIYLLINEIDLCELISGCGTPPINNDPVVTDIVINIPNRSTRVFTEMDFDSHYTDPEGDYLASVKTIGNVVDYKLANNPYVSDTEVFLFNVQQGLFKFVAQNTDLAYQSVVQWRAKDSQGNWSNAATLTINVAEKIIPNFAPVTIALIRGISNTKTASVAYTNGNGQTLTAGQTLYTTGTVGQPGYIRAYVQNSTVLSSSGTFNIVVTSIPHNTLGGNPAAITYTIDSGVGTINFTYSSIPTNETFTENTDYLDPIFFTPSMFTAHMADLDGDESQVRILPITSAGIAESLTGYKLNGSNYTGSWIDITDLGNLEFHPENIIAGYNKTNKWEVKDSQGNIST